MSVIATEGAHRSNFMLEIALVGALRVHLGHQEKQPYSKSEMITEQEKRNVFSSLRSKI